MTKRKADYPTLKASSIIDGLPETERFDRSFRNSESGDKSADAEFHWMAHASYNLSKLKPEL